MHGWFHYKVHGKKPHRNKPHGYKPHGYKPHWRADEPGRKVAGDGVSGGGLSGAARPMTESRTLTDLPGGTRAQVRRIGGGHRLLNRLLALGLAPGVQLRVLRNPRRGPLLVLVNDTRVALGRGEAAKLQAAPETAWEGAADAAE
jgi:ferrous iron transport protein A